MATNVSMSSNALLRIGHSEINSFSDAGAGAKVASNLYQTVYESELTSHPWRFSVGKVALSQLTAAPLNEWTYAYQLPGTLMTVLRTYPRTDFEIYEDKIYCNVNTLDIDYTFKPSESALPPHFVKLMELRLASEFAVAVTNNRALSETYKIMADEQMLVAANLDSRQRPNQAIASSPFTDVRR